MKLFSDGKINEDGTIFSNELITEKEGYEAMLYMLTAYWEATGSNDLTDILSGGEYSVSCESLEEDSQVTHGCRIVRHMPPHAHTQPNFVAHVLSNCSSNHHHNEPHIHTF